MAYSGRDERLRESFNIAQEITNQVLRDYSYITYFELKNNNPAYEVWVQYKDRVIMLHSFTALEIESCTDPNELTAIQFREEIRRRVQGAVEKLISGGNR